MTITDPRPGVWLAAYDLLRAAQEIRAEREQATQRRCEPEPMPEAYGFCLAEAEVLARLACAPEVPALAVGAALHAREVEEARSRKAGRDFVDGVNARIRAAASPPDTPPDTPPPPARGESMPAGDIVAPAITTTEENRSE